MRSYIVRIEKWYVPAHGVCVFFADPRQSARDASVFWHPACCGHMLRGHIHKPDFPHFGQIISLKDKPGNHMILQDSNGMQQIFLRNKTHYCALNCQGVSAAFDQFVLELTLSENIVSPSFLRQLAIFEILMKGEVLPFDDKDSTSSLSRQQQFQRDTLFIFDRKQMGFSDRETAITLYGETTIREEWKDRSGPLRARIRRLIASGRRLYRDNYQGSLNQVS